MQMPVVSIIIPCYNHGLYIDETIASIEQIDDKALYEVIIVNDGSTDAYTNERLTEIAKKYTVITQANAGLSAARNTGIAAATGKYILPVDSDNKIHASYLYKGIEVLDNDPSISIVYGNANLFGASTGIKQTYPFNLQRLMISNYIDACAMYRKDVWKITGGYDVNMRHGYEDWEFWLNAAFKGCGFKYIDDQLFDYRVLHTSMVHQLAKDKTKVNNIITYMSEKHSQYYGPQYIDQDILFKFSKNPLAFWVLLFLKKNFPRSFNKLVAKGKLRKYI